MLIRLLERLGYDGKDDVMNFVMCGLATLPVLLMICGFTFAGAMSLFVLLLLAAAVGFFTPSAESLPHEEQSRDAGDPPPDV